MSFFFFFFFLLFGRKLFARIGKYVRRLVYNSNNIIYSTIRVYAKLGKILSKLNFKFQNLDSNPFNGFVNKNLSWIQVLEVGSSSRRPSDRISVVLLLLTIITKYKSLYTSNCSFLCEFYFTILNIGRTYHNFLS